ncbi:tRNA (adenosine(37)-N6)-threonylcarbamoyltransferase complex ATPase subunit type 1 TsaE, partial [Candidatus Uhrbacteria bacterium]|nr:tRNA (adenosine(37)-N6)-threonylcarbamoyltransferase complex ATPase subunit type 1 TsaE [Candidatus Uhrbacteria bacterium]
LAKKLGAKDHPRSPTFSLVRTYQLKAKSYPLSRLVHVDAYRIEKPEDLLPLNLEEELQEPETIIALEWPENVEPWLKKQPSVIECKISVKENQEREVSWLSDASS